ncbi:uncharacterized protein LOC136074057 [Hydra vulgaris]|uniref:Uncharacterized protein LOC136074057 n=1 Tax=Hydra vulgaris TaxID=6087 RepID=A0ABM4B0X2_HYDVU
MTTPEVFNFTEMPVIDNGIERYEEHEYELINGTNLNRQLVKADGTAYANTDAVVLTNNGLMQLFGRITYQLSNQDTEAVYYQDQATTMLGMLNYANDFQLAQGFNQLRYKDSTSTAVIADNQGFLIRQAYIIQKLTLKGTFSFCVPLRHIFGFCDDYDKVIYGLKHTITLVRQSYDSAIFRLAAVAAEKVNLISFGIRQCDTTTVQQSTSFNWQFAVKTSPENPRYIIVGFQTSRTGDQTANASIFDHYDLKNMYIMLNNNDRYPAVD